MSWVAVDNNGDEMVYLDYPDRYVYMGTFGAGELNYCSLPKGSIKKLIGRDLTWEDDPVELKEEL